MPFFVVCRFIKLILQKQLSHRCLCQYMIMWNFLKSGLRWSFKKKITKPYPAHIFVLKCLLFTSAAYIQVHFRLNFIMEANTMNPDQTAPSGAV